MLHLRAALLGALALLVLAWPAGAAEVINAFATDIVLRADRSVLVTETIDVTAEGREIRRGIYRDIPTTLINPDGSRLRSTLTVIAVTRDGHSEPFRLENLGNGYQRIRIGDADVLLRSGRHRYVIRYTMTRMGRSFADHDELYWNATGNYWNFPILEAVARVRLPEGAVIADLSGYTGRPGSTEQAVTTTRVADDTATFRATRQLASGEGLTVAATFQPGILVAPDDRERALWWLSDHRGVVVPLVAALLVLVYYALAWNAVGRDPEKGVIIPLFHPPRRFSPALLHYVHRWGWEKSGWTAFTASIFALGVKGLVTIDNSGSKLRVAVTGRAPGQEPEAALPPGEQVLFDFLNARGSLRIDSRNGAAIDKTRRDFVSRIESENRQVYFRNNLLYTLGGMALSALGLGAMVYFEVLDPVFLIVAVVLGVAAGLFTSVLGRFWRGNLMSRFILLVWLTVAGANMMGGLARLVTSASLDTPLVAALSIVLINIVFAILMRAPTVQGRRIMDQIDGFRMYLETAEANRLNLTGAPPMTVERFESILPYAIALGVEKPWSEHFQAELGRHAVADAPADYQPAWYSGRSWSTASSSFGSTAAAITSGMSAAMIASTPSSSSSSGGGGGGSSGGGGGGGGGGGW